MESNLFGTYIGVTTSLIVASVIVHVRTQNVCACLDIDEGDSFAGLEKDKVELEYSRSALEDCKRHLTTVIYSHNAAGLFVATVYANSLPSTRICASSLPGTR